MSERGQSARSPGKGLFSGGLAVAIVAAAAALLSWGYVQHPERATIALDPGYYTWRTEALLTEAPATLIRITNQFDTFAGGYRVALPILGGVMRRVSGISSFKLTTVLSIVLPVLTAVALAGFAYRQRRDPLIFHAVLVVSLGLLITEPFVGYLDQVLSLLLLSAGLLFLPQIESGWPARLGLGMLLVMTGLSHPPTLAIFAATLVAGVGWDVVVRRRGPGEALRLNRALLFTLLVSLLLVLSIWTVGLWGRSSPLSEAAVMPDQGPEQLFGRLREWMAALSVGLNGPLLIAGVAGVVATAKSWTEDPLTRWSLAWLLPLAGLAGFVVSARLPFYRFVTATAAWILLAGVGAYFVVRLALGSFRKRLVLLVALVGVAVAVAATFTTWSAALAVWNRPGGRWLSANKRQNLDELRAQLAAHTDPDRPVLFVFDDEPARRDPYAEVLVQERALRYGVPAGQIDRAYFYLGDLRSYFADRPTPSSDPRYSRMSRALLESARTGVRAAGQAPVVVLEAAANGGGRNHALLREPARISALLERSGGGAELWVVRDGRVTRWLDGRPSLQPVLSSQTRSPGRHAAWVGLGLALLLVPGVLSVKRFSPAADFLDAFALVGPLALSLIALSGLLVLAVTRAPLDPRAGWLSLGVATAVAGALYLAPPAHAPEGGTRRERPGESSQPGPASPPEVSSSCSRR